MGSGSGLTAGDFRIWRGSRTERLLAAGNGLNSFSGDMPPRPRAQFDTPAGMAIDRGRNLYFADRRIIACADFSRRNITTVAGLALPGFRAMAATPSAPS